MIDAPFALAFAAGMVASVNPCGFAMLPAYLSVLVGTGGQGASRPAAVARVLRVGLIVAGGFLVVFGMAGVGLTAGARWITTAVPWAALGVGLLAVVGLSLVAGRSLPLRLPSPARAPTGGGTAATALFGISYAVASLSCTLPVFLVVLGGAGTQASLAAGVATFGAYAVGMALPLVGVAVALAVGNDALVRRARRASRHATRVAGGLLMVAGGYIVFYWATVLGPPGDARPGDRLVTGVETVSSRATSLLGARPLLVGVVLAVTVAAAVGYVWRHRHRRGKPGGASGVTST